MVLSCCSHATLGTAIPAISKHHVCLQAGGSPVLHLDFSGALVWGAADLFLSWSCYISLIQHSALSYMLSASPMCAYRQVAVLCFIKFSGALVWGAADILQVKYSEMPMMQSLGDGPQTLGLVFASVGVGCFFGPILFNWFTPPKYTLLAYHTLSADTGVGTDLTSLYLQHSKAVQSSLHCFKLSFVLHHRCSNDSLVQKSHCSALQTAVQGLASCLLPLFFRNVALAVQCSACISMAVMIQFTRGLIPR